MGTSPATDLLGGWGGLGGLLWSFCSFSVLSSFLSGSFDLQGSESPTSVGVIFREPLLFLWTFLGDLFGILLILYKVLFCFVEGFLFF